VIFKKLLLVTPHSVVLATEWPIN